MAAALLALLSFPTLRPAPAAPAVPEGFRPLSTKTVEIWNGKPAPASSADWQVAFVSSALPTVDTLFCGGTLVGAQWVLTAAHCFHHPETCEQYMNVHHFYVSHGSTALGERAKLEAAERIVYSPEWECKTRRGDVALVKLRRAVPVAAIKLATVAQSDTLLAPGSGALISGWGLTEGHERSRDLLEAPITIADPQTCKAAYGQILPDKTVCGGDTVHDACTGDSGGPLFVRDASGVPTQLGIVSFGKGCAQRGFPGIYARVANYREWIEKQTTSCSPDDVRAGRC